MSFDYEGRGPRRTALNWAALVAMALGASSAHAALSPGLLSQQTSVVADSIKKEAEMCATGEAEGTIGNAIKNAVNIHTQLAAAMPNTEELFSPVQDCFSGLLGTWDLSFAIPSLASVRDAVSGAMVKFAQKKVCSTVSQARSMVVTPINQAIGGLTGGTGMGGIGDLNGLSNGLIGGGLAQIDPELGWQYAKPPAQTDYNINVNPFSGQPLDFGGGASPGGSAGSSGGLGSSGAVGQIGTGNSQIGAVNSQLANLQAQVGPAQQAVSKAQSRLSSCQAQAYNNCTSYQADLQNAQGTLNGLNSSIASLRGQLSGASAASAASVAPASSRSDGMLDRLGSYFN